ncbi:glycosyltransferase [Crateriforma spongiae]|uniref:glycosyltransferase n=1 Tax=Crateriforma spongiae TaxID=2724528 RepID=UPI0039B08286
MERAHAQKRPRVLVVYHYIAKYREAVFKRLASTEEVVFEYAASSVCPNDIALMEDPAIEFGDKFHSLENRWFFSRVLWQSGLLRLLASRRYDSVVFLGDPNFLSTWCCLVLSKFLGVKTYLWTHGFIGSRSATKEIMAKLFFRLSDGLLLYGDGAKSRLIDAGFRAEKIHVIYNSLDYETQKAIRLSLPADSTFKTRQHLFDEASYPCLIFIGRLTYHKKLDQLIQLLSDLRLRGIVANLLLVGDGEARPMLEQRVHELGLAKRVHFYGRTYDEHETGKLISCCDVCVSPGEIGLTAMHVMAYGTPVITHGNAAKQMPEFEAVIDGVTGRLFCEGVEGALLEATYDFLKKPIENVRINCIRVIEDRYMPDIQVARICEAVCDAE